MILEDDQDDNIRRYLEDFKMIILQVLKYIYYGSSQE